MKQELSQSRSDNLLQSGSIIITKLDMCLKVRQLYYKLRELLQRKPVHFRDTRANELFIYAFIDITLS